MGLGDLGAKIEVIVLKLKTQGMEPSTDQIAKLGHEKGDSLAKGSSTTTLTRQQ